MSYTNAQMQTPQRNPRPEAPSFVPNNTNPYDAVAFDPSFGSYSNVPQWGSLAPQASMLGSVEMPDGSSKKRRILQPPPMIDIECCKIPIPDINQLTSLVQVQCAMYEKAMERIIVLEKNNNKLLAYCHSMVRWSQTVTTVNVVSASGGSELTPPSEEAEDNVGA
ncbi:hypothetical protein BST61_g11306 [Cercospora zeina]